VLQAKRVWDLCGSPTVADDADGFIAEGAGMAGGRSGMPEIHGVKYFTVGEAMVWEMM